MFIVCIIVTLFMSYVPLLSSARATEESTTQLMPIIDPFLSTQSLSSSDLHIFFQNERRRIQAANLSAVRGHVKLIQSLHENRSKLNDLIESLHAECTFQAGHLQQLDNIFNSLLDIAPLYPHIKQKLEQSAREYDAKRKKVFNEFKANIEMFEEISQTLEGKQQTDHQRHIKSLKERTGYTFFDTIYNS